MRNSFIHQMQEGQQLMFLRDGGVSISPAELHLSEMLVSVITASLVFATFDCWGILLTHGGYFSQPQFPDKKLCGLQYVGHKQQ